MKYFQSTYRGSIDRGGKRDIAEDGTMEASTVERNTEGSLGYSTGEYSRVIQKSRGREEVRMHKDRSMVAESAA
jgi:hypothetical protein